MDPNTNEQPKRTFLQSISGISMLLSLVLLVLVSFGFLSVLSLTLYNAFINPDEQASLNVIFGIIQMGVASLGIDLVGKFYRHSKIRSEGVFKNEKLFKIAIKVPLIISIAFYILFNLTDKL